VDSGCVGWSPDCPGARHCSFDPGRPVGRSHFCYRVEKVGGAIHTEYWIPAEDLTEFNSNIVGAIEVSAEFR
jgi:hypothetical protein